MELILRGRTGVITTNTSKKAGNVVSVMRVKEDSGLMIVTPDGRIVRIE